MARVWTIVRFLFYFVSALIALALFEATLSYATVHDTLGILVATIVFGTLGVLVPSFKCTKQPILAGKRRFVLVWILSASTIIGFIQLKGKQDESQFIESLQHRNGNCNVLISGLVRSDVGQSVLKLAASYFRPSFSYLHFAAEEVCRAIKIKGRYIDVPEQSGSVEDKLDRFERAFSEIHKLAPFGIVGLTMISATEVLLSVKLNGKAAGREDGADEKACRNLEASFRIAEFIGKIGDLVKGRPRIYDIIPNTSKEDVQFLTQEDRDVIANGKLAEEYWKGLASLSRQRESGIIIAVDEKLSENFSEVMNKSGKGIFSSLQRKLEKARTPSSKNNCQDTAVFAQRIQALQSKYSAMPADN